MNTQININRKLIFALFLFILTVTIDSCKKDLPNVLDVNRQLLTTRTWEINTVTVDGVEKTAAFAGLTLSFQDGSYSTSHGTVVWPASGTWTFKDDSGSLILRNDNIEITITSITARQLVLELVWNKNTLGSGRVGSIAGKHVFTFI
jgi:hypothetical protein